MVCNEDNAKAQGVTVGTAEHLALISANLHKKNEMQAGSLHGIIYKCVKTRCFGVLHSFPRLFL